MTIRAALNRPSSIIGFAFVVMLLLASFAFAAQASAMPGDFYKGQLNAAKKKCKAQKNKRARSRCLRTSKNKAASATKRAMRGDQGFYGFRLKQKRIPPKNGMLIWSKRETGTRNAQNASRTHNVLYSSKSFPGNRKIVVSGTVMIPKGKPPRGGWPVISWAHGTVGLADQCAPSRLLGKSYYGSESGQLISEWLKTGYAVVATDYEGLGTPGIHPYLIGNSEGRGVLDIVQAARQLDGKISRRVVLAGHSQGGQAILFAANLATTNWGRGSSYLGTVSYAPASNLDQQAPLISTFDNQPGQYGIAGLALSILRGAVAGDPRIKPSGVLTEDALEQYPKTDTLCSGQLSDALEAVELKPGKLLKPGWPTSSDGDLFNEQLKKMNPAVEVGAPVLIPQGDADTTVLPVFTGALVGQLRDLNPQQGRITYETFPGANHSSILPDSESKTGPFIRSLFEG